MNGNSVNSEVKGDERASVDKEENSEILDDHKSERSNLHLDKNIEKVLHCIPAFELFAFAISCKE